MIYVILTHDSPEYLKCLLERLENKNNVFIIHVDQNSQIQPFLEVVENIPNCYFTPIRFKTGWGSFGLVEATLHAFKFIQNTIQSNQRIILLSGSDYPIKSNNYIHNFLDKHKNTIFIEFKSIPNKSWNQGGIDRFPAFDTIKDIVDLYGGSQWFSIPYNILFIIFEFLKLNPHFIEYFKIVRIPDESFFQTLFLNCGNSCIQNNLINQSLHFIKWETHRPHPKILTLENYRELVNSKRLFARKFNMKYSMGLIDKLNNYL